MLHSERGSSAPRHGVRLLSLVAVCISIAGLLPASRASAQAGSDSVATPAIQRPAPITQTPTQPSTVPAAAKPKPKANSIHLQGGLFVPIEVNATSPTLGLRMGRRLGSHLQGGLLVDWTFERKNLEQPVNGLPGLQPNLILARADGQLVPVMAFLQVNLTEVRFLVPYAGIAAGYEWLMLKVNDYRTDEKAKATYTNWAWQSWGGLGIRLDRGLRVDAELFYNGGSLERDVTDSNGLSLHEAVDVNGVGARLGLDMLF